MSRRDIRLEPREYERCLRDLDLRPTPLQLLEYSLGELVDLYRICATPEVENALRVLFVYSSRIPGVVVNIDKERIPTAKAMIRWLAEEEGADERYRQKA